MEAVAHNPSFAKKAGVPVSVGKHFHEADKQMKRKFNEGGTPPPAKPNKPVAPKPPEKPKPPKTDNEREAESEDIWANIAHPKYKQGGHVKPSQLEGKTKETKAIADEEMKALKRGHAPKEIMEHEKAEHKAMGYKHGGGVKRPHPAKVTKAETHQKGYAMKKGGHVKKHEKHMKRGGVSAKRMKRPGMPIDPAALMAQATPASAPMQGGLGGMPSSQMPPMGGGMKKGGHVMHHNAHHGHGHQIHHHHHYAKGGAIRREDGIASRGHTKGKQVKMASGGHVGSHPSRRADGVAQKGHTRCKVC
jgi:hypothetical protein